MLNALTSEDDRLSRFDPSEVDELALRSRRGESTPKAAVVETRVTAIVDGQYYYRGRLATELVDEPYEKVASFLCSGVWPEQLPEWIAPAPALERAKGLVVALGDEALLIDDLRVIAAAAAVGDPFRLDLRAEAVLKQVGPLIALLVAALPEKRASATTTIAESLWNRLSSRDPETADLRALNGALVLLADHELAASTFAARIAASFRADPASVLGAALGPLSGALHGAASIEAVSMLKRASEDGTDREISARLSDGDLLPGFGHPLYPKGDPRTPTLLALAEDCAPGHSILDVSGELTARVEERGLPLANVDFGLATLVVALDLEDDAGEAIFAIARCAGWLAHAIEEYEQRSDLRPRARYVGIRVDG